ncbi:unnamed protein product [Musa textilis]
MDALNPDKINKGEGREWGTVHRVEIPEQYGRLVGQRRLVVTSLPDAQEKPLHRVRACGCIASGRLVFGDDDFCLDILCSSKRFCLTHRGFSFLFGKQTRCSLTAEPTPVVDTGPSQPN